MYPEGTDGTEGWFASGKRAILTHPLAEDGRSGSNPCGRARNRADYSRARPVDAFAPDR